MAAVALELADALDRPEVAVNAADVLERAYASGVRFVLGWSFFLPRLLGVAAALEREHTRALAMLGRAEAEARQIGAVGEAARSLYALGCVQNDVGAPEAAKTFDVAIDELERLGYRLVLDNACTSAGRSLVRARASDEQRRVIVVTDLADSTPLAHRVGDHRFVELLREHNRIVRSRLRQFDGIEFKHTGDGIAAWFLTAGAAIECGLRIKADIEESNRSRADDPLEVRIGMAAGEVVTDGNDVFGIAVITAFRICDLARDGRILLAPELAEMLDHAAVQLEPLNDVVLKGFSEPQTLYAVASDRT
jgi:class 3 adenylate cyclase